MPLFSLNSNFDAEYTFHSAGESQPEGRHLDHIQCQPIKEAPLSHLLPVLMNTLSIFHEYYYSI